MESCQIKVERDSVCMGDDMDAPHSYTFKLSLDATLQDVFDHLASKRYLASVSGNNHSWEGIIGGKSLVIFKGNNQYPESSDVLADVVSEYSINRTLNIRFKYNSEPRV